MLNSFQVTSKSFAELNKQELYSILALRIQVFCVEQNCPYQDIDGLDSDAQHFIVKNADEIIAYTRVIPTKNGVCHIGRVVVAEDFRMHKLATKIMHASIKYCQNNFSNAIIQVSAQSYLSDFYKKLGFISMENYYLEDDIPHEQMKILLD